MKAHLVSGVSTTIPDQIGIQISWFFEERRKRRYLSKKTLRAKARTANNLNIASPGIRTRVILVAGELLSPLRYPCLLFYLTSSYPKIPVSMYYEA